MKIGICVNACPAPYDEQFALMKKYGFETTFAMADNPDIDTVVETGVRAGLEFENLHATFAKIDEINCNAMWHSDERGQIMLDRLKTNVDTCARHGIPRLVVHLSAGENAPRVTDAGYRNFSALMDYARDAHVQIAYENARKLANIAFALEVFPDAGFCWDTGHEECFAHGRRFMPLFGDRLIALHIHDNFKEHKHDCHMLPYDAAIDFDRVAKQIAESGYEGSLMLEVSKMKNEYGRYVEMSNEEFYERASQAVKRLRDAVLSYRK